MSKIKVLIVDDSAIVRDILTDKLSVYNDIEIVGSAPDPFIARNKILTLNPDVITLDIEMPKMDGLTFLQKLMDYYPLPVIIVSSVTTKDKNASIKALEIGAFDVVNKPGGSLSINEVVEDVLQKIRMAYQVKDTFTSRRKIVESKIVTQKVVKHQSVISNVKTTDKIIVIGSSTGGTLALEYIFNRLPHNLPPIVVVQHMPINYTRQFAERLNELSDMTVKESEDNELITNGFAYIAKGGTHLQIYRKGTFLYLAHRDFDKVQYQKPSVDVMFSSIAKESGKNTLGILLTGMGKDGAEGLLELKNRGAVTVAQDEESSIVWGMPKAAIDINAHTNILSLSDIPNFIVNFAKE